MTLFGLLLVVITPFTNAEFSRTYIDQHPIQIASVNGVDIGYRLIGERDKPKVVLIMGLGASNVVPGDNLARGIAQAGYQLVLFDNRDTGASTRFDDWGQPLVWWQLLKLKLGLGVSAPYTLDDMAADTVALMDWLNIEDAHIIGFSMGGMIAQKIAVHHPERTKSLTLVMTTTGAKHLPPPTAEARKLLTNLASGEAAQERATAFRERGFYTESMPRQMMAIFKDGDRSAAVRTIVNDTLILHGKDDILIPPAHGVYTADIIENSELVIFPGMGHNVPDLVLPEFLARVTGHFSAADMVSSGR
jgi:pimeloyl-ACP methyl ester carboxylesterase